MRGRRRKPSRRAPADGGACQGLVQPFQHAETVRKDVVAPEAHPVALLSQKPVSLFVGGGVRSRVLAGVQFDEQFFGKAGEVGDIRADGLLAAKLVAAQLLVAEVVPQQPFRVGLVLAQGPGAAQGLEGALAFDVRPRTWGMRRRVPPTGSPAGWRPCLADSPSRGE